MSLQGPFFTITHTLIYYEKHFKNIYEEPLENVGIQTLIVPYEKIHEFYKCGEYIYVLYVPHDVLTSDSLNYPGCKLCKTNQLVITGKYHLYNVNTIKTLNLKITPEYINDVCSLGLIDILDFLVTSNYSFEYDDWSLYYASVSNQEKVLKWWFNSGLPLKYSTSAMDCASDRGYTNILQLWKDSGVRLAYTGLAMAYASKNGHVNALQWWKDSGLTIRYLKYALTWATSFNRINVLEWWKDSGLPLAYPSNLLDGAEEYGCQQSIQWWKDSGLPYHRDNTHDDDLKDFVDDF
jgi:hypothetical protein